MSVKNPTMQLADDCEIVSRSIEEIATFWPDFSFKSPDGRRFNFIEDSAGTIAVRVKALGLRLTEHEQAELERICGAIVEVGVHHPPLLFDSSESLIHAWCELHDSFYVPFTEREQALLLGLR